MIFRSSKREGLRADALSVVNPINVFRRCTEMRNAALIGSRKWADLIRRWVEDYSFQRANTTRGFLEPRGLPALLGKLRDVSWPYAITGSLAASRVAPVAAPRLATLYVENVDASVEALGLRPAKTATNVILAEPFDSVVFDRTWKQDGNIYAALSQVAADLLTGPGRSPAEGEELLRWMGENEDAWRA
jgi:hypothetical protein